MFHKQYVRGYSLNFYKMQNTETRLSQKRDDILAQESRDIVTVFNHPVQNIGKRFEETVRKKRFEEITVTIIPSNYTHTFVTRLFYSNVLLHRSDFSDENFTNI